MKRKIIQWQIIIFWRIVLSFDGVCGATHATARNYSLWYHWTAILIWNRAVHLLHQTMKNERKSTTMHTGILFLMISSVPLWSTTSNSKWWSNHYTYCQLSPCVTALKTFMRNYVYSIIILSSFSVECSHSIVHCATNGSFTNFIIDLNFNHTIICSSFVLVKKTRILPIFMCVRLLSFGIKKLNFW